MGRGQREIEVPISSFPNNYMPKGQYEYPFQFQFQLPPNLPVVHANKYVHGRYSYCMIKYALSANLSKPGGWTKTLTSKKELFIGNAIASKSSTSPVIMPLDTVNVAASIEDPSRYLARKTRISV